MSHLLTFWNWPLLARTVTAFALLTAVARGGYHVGMHRIGFLMLRLELSRVDPADEEGKATIANLDSENRNL